jgi:penicillin-binding protein 2
MRLRPVNLRTQRTAGAAFAIAFALGVLLTAFFDTQIVRGAYYAVRAEDNRLRPIPIPAPRGLMLDRHGDVVATNITGYSVAILPASEAVVRRTLEDLAPFLGLSAPDIDRLLERRHRRPNDLLFVTEDATFAQVAAIEERQFAFPNVLLVERPKRYYPAGEAVGHVVGYVGEITKEELARSPYRQAGYRQGRWIGKAGLERTYEFWLAGQDGARYVEEDAAGRIVNPTALAGELPPRPGRTLRLTLDQELQRYVHTIWPDTMNGALVALVPSTGEVLALYSHPTFDPNDFVEGVTGRLWRALTSDPNKPMLNRAIDALYPPASTFKLATAAMGLRRGLLRADTRMPIPCTGGMYYAGRYARCWVPEGHGSLDLLGAIEKSCNVYFYQVGIELGLKEIIAQATRLGFARRTGIDLPGEKPGVFPTSLGWYRQRFGYFPVPSEVMYLAIGQGPNTQTVIRMGLFYSAIAGNGTAPAPHLAARDTSHLRPVIDLGLTTDQLQTLWAGLARVPGPGGTAWLSSLERWKLYGKTGTAQNPHGGDHGWFVGFAGPPGSPPEVAVAVLVEHGLHGSDVAPLAAKAADFYLRRKYGLPPDPRPILLERWMDGRCPWGVTCTVPDRASALMRPTPRFDAQGRLLNPPPGSAAATANGPR